MFLHNTKLFFLNQVKYEDFPLKDSCFADRRNVHVATERKWREYAGRYLILLVNILTGHIGIGIIFHKFLYILEKRLNFALSEDMIKNSSMAPKVFLLIESNKNVNA